ncbi:MuDR family transposase containing protein [Striga asiatica]|uniref:MuDR family transposase containing protein n=1 Tax=Striga asiatica TaxID=4170 RepID=A0A5A7QJP2_STRAF|nr:MuDR family transposase containing protein [Striga asiatica]
MSGQRQATSNVVSSFIKTKFSNTKTSYNPGDIIDDMQHRFGINLSYHKAWRSKRKAVDEVRGNPNDSYEYVHQYLEKVLYIHTYQDYPKIGRLVAGISEDNNCGANWFNIFTTLSTIYISLIRTYFRLIQHYLPQLEIEC